METPKLTKNEIRFSKLIRPAVNSIVEFSPVMILCNSVTARMTGTMFIKKWMVEGGKCMVIENCENVVLVEGGEGSETDLISPEFLISRELTDEAMRAVDALKKALSISTN